MEERRYLKLDDLSSYKISFSLSNYVWNLIKDWDYLDKQVVGIQFIKSIDSISANIAEGFGRRFKKDKVKFYYYSFGSLSEAMDWLEKSKTRELITPEDYDYINNELQKLPREINQLIKFTLERMSR